jgi:hypothetical protein
MFCVYRVIFWCLKLCAIERLKRETSKSCCGAHSSPQEGSLCSFGDFEFQFAPACYRLYAAAGWAISFASTHQYLISDLITGLLLLRNFTYITVYLFTLFSAAVSSHFSSVSFMAERQQTFSVGNPIFPFIKIEVLIYCNYNYHCIIAL